MPSTRTGDRHRSQPVIVRLDDDLRTQLRARAGEEERTQTQVIRRALRLYLATAQAESGG